MKAFRRFPHAGWTAASLLIAAALIALAVWSFRSKDPVDVRVVSPSYQDLTSTVSTNGKVYPIDDFQARSAFAGSVEKLYVQLGQKVKAGQMLVKMKDPFAASRYASAAAALEGAKLSDENVHQNGSQEDRINLKGDLAHAQLEQTDATHALELLKHLQSIGSASPGEVAAGERRLAADNATLQTLRDRSTHRYSKEDIKSSDARIADARASLDTARIVLANANLTADIGGTVYSIPVSTYDFVPMGAELLRIADLNRVQVRAYFDEAEIGQLAEGQAVDVVWDAKPNQLWHGHIKQAPLAISAVGTRNVGECIITVDDANGALLPNTDVTVRVTTGRRPHVLSIPREALHTDDGVRVVYRVVNDKLVRTPVHVGLVNLNRVEITGGLAEKDTIVRTAMSNHELADGLAIRIVP